MITHIKILILNWNRKDLLKHCLDSVIAIDYPNYSVIMIDNGSSDGSLDMVQENYSKVECLALDRNYGYAGGYNRCFAQLKDETAEFIMLLNNDTVIDLDILNSFNNARMKFGDSHIYGGKIYYLDDPNKIWYAGGRVKLKYINISHWGIRKQDSPEFSNPIETDYITGCCLFTSMEVINKLNGFDERFNMYGEDVDLCLRAKNLGINCYYWPDAKLWHHVSASLDGAFSFKKLSKKLIGIGRLYHKHYLELAKK